jgi:hypothetical protein
MFEFEYVEENPQYEVWLLGFDKEGNANDYECFLVDFEDLDDAVAYAHELFDMGNAKGGSKKLREIFNIPANVDSVEVRVEEVVQDKDDEDCISNQGTPFAGIIFLR